MPIRIAVLTDIHYAATASGARRGDIGHVLLKRAIMRLNRFLHPDVVVVLGDIVDDPSAPDCSERYAEVLELLNGLTAPWLILPGNHDVPPEAFYRHFPREGMLADVAGVRFLTFVDPGEPGFNARRLPEGLACVASARNGWNGPLVALQHTSLFPPGEHTCPYNLVNADEVIAGYRASGVDLSISGHYHAGFHVEGSGVHFVTGGSLCDAPFVFTEIIIDGDAITSRRHELSMPAELALADAHSHTPYAYCAGADMDIAQSIELAASFGLASLSFTEHSGQLYFTAKDYWGGRYFNVGVDEADASESRMDDYFEEVEAFRSDRLRIGLEVDCDRAGRVVLRPEHRDRADVVVGSIHALATVMDGVTDPGEIRADFLSTAARFLQAEIDVLAHPLRMFSMRGINPTPELRQRLAQLLLAHGVAAEMNFHNIDPDLEFFRTCIDAGVKISLAADAHAAYEVGELWPHLRMLESLGVGVSRLDEVLMPPWGASAS